MVKFEPITTQEAFDAAVAQRIEAEREAILQKYADYDTLKTRSGELEMQLADARRAAQASAEKSANDDAQIAQLTEQVRGYERSALCQRVAHETGLPFEMADRLRGETEEDMRKDASALARFVVPQFGTTAPLASTEPVPASPYQVALDGLMQQLSVQA